jgi:hypothetical protein
MRRNLVAVIALFFVAVPMIGQNQRNYVAGRSVSLSSAAEALTVQLPATAKRTVGFTGASIYCSAECTFTLERDGTLATATGVMPIPLNLADEWGVANAFYSSNVGTGKTIARHVVPAGQTMVMDLAGKTLIAGQNLTIRTNSVTATVVINVQWREN